ncbi:IclR family transcriptional regulator [Salsuginibacillus kocurii]|uniref:IclR family transcriptional regulator n=1 Tax=Salsuginibacillus kocurii TaxID=427078 RepID=UPI0003611291|nr:IclR family transcriptional regulator [Salsuginibacillus kocurii]
MNTRRYTSLENAIRILKSFSDRNLEFGVSELAEQLNLGISTTHRLLISLAEEGFVVKNKETNKYTLGLSILQLTNTVTEQIHIIREASPILQKLTDDTGESTHLGIIDFDEVIYLQKIETPHPTSPDSYLGKRAPIYCTGAGQTILAFQSNRQVERVLSQPLTPYTDYTITDTNQLKSKFAQIKKDGFTANSQEFQKDMFSVTSPVYNKDNYVIAAISIIGPLRRMKPQKNFLIEKTLKAGNTLSSIVKRRQRQLLSKGGTV